MLLERVEREGVTLNTYSRGRAPIDSIMCKQGVDVKKVGCLSFGEEVGYHRPIFFDIKKASSLGVNLPAPKSMTARRLKINDPIITKNVLKLL